MKELFERAYDCLRQGRDLVLCSIIASSGSTPRGSGAKMAVFDDGETFGTIGGGAVEHQSILLARQALADRAAFTHGFNLNRNQTADIGMICGGQVVVYFQYFSGGDRETVALFAHILGLFDTGANAWLVTKITEGGVRQMGVYQEGEGLLFADGIAPDDVLPLMSARSMLRTGEPSYYVEPLNQAGLVYVFGGGHVSQELVPVLARVGFRVAVYEDRAAFAAPERFPEAAERIVGPYADAMERLAVGPEDYIVIMTRGHQADYEVLEQALRTPAAYIGVIGSRHKIALTNRRLLEAGIPEAELSRIHAPIGLSIQAETPAEIAVSIAGELILHRAKRSGERRYGASK